MDVESVLRMVPFLAPVSPAAMQRLIAASILRHVRRGDFLFHTGDEVTQIFVIATGRVAATLSSPGGTLLFFHVARAGETPGHNDLLLDSGYSASAQALSEVSVVAISRAVCVEVLESEPAALVEYARGLGRIISLLTASMADMVFLDLERRLARALDASAQTTGYALGLTQSEWAAQLGVARQSLNQALAKLMSRGLVENAPGGGLRIRDHAALELFVASGRR